MKLNVLVLIVVMLIAICSLAFVAGYRSGYVAANNIVVDAVGQNCINACANSFGCYGCNYEKSSFITSLNITMPGWMKNES